MTLSIAEVTQIRQLHYRDRWKVGTIAAQLGHHPDAVKHALGLDSPRRRLPTQTSPLEPFKDFVIEKPEHSPHYEYRLHDPDDPKSFRRSVYRFIVRSQQQPFMTTLDCADPSMQVGRRNESQSPLQALAMLNNALMLTMAKHFAAKLDASGGDLPAKVQRAYQEAIGRNPSPEDQAVLTEYAQQFGLTNFCRVLFNLNEFSFVD